MSENQKEIVLKETVLNITYYSSEENSSAEEFSDPDLESDEEFVDKETEIKQEFLKKRLSEIADVEVVGKDFFKIVFLEKGGITLEDVDRKCDFDFDEKNIPTICSGGEDFILPYLKCLCRCKKILSPLHIKLNISPRKFTF